MNRWLDQRVGGEIMKGPIQYSYWVSSGQLLAGEYPRDLDKELSLLKLNALVQAGISAFIDLTEERDGLLPYDDMLEGVHYERFPVRDVSVPASSEVMRTILDAIDTHIGQSRAVYVHCWGGIGRTGTVVGCYLIRHGLATPADAMERIARLRRNDLASFRQSPETGIQRRMVQSWTRGR